MPNVKLLARDVLFEVNRGTSGSPLWTEIKGINNFSPSPTKNDTNTTTFDTDGWLEHLVASRGFSLTLSGLRLEDPDDGARDPGQKYVEESAFAFSYDAEESYRITTPGGEVWQFSATAEVQPWGGGNDDANSWNATLTVNRAVTRVGTGS